MMFKKLLLSRKLIKEAGEGHRAQFDYANYHLDPSPDVLVLGHYRHPSTGNDLVGAINLNYLTKDELNDLRSILPNLTRLSGLKKRYDYGKTVLPYVFDEFFREYNVDHIDNLKTGVLYPIYGTLKKDESEARAAQAEKEKQAQFEPQRVRAQADLRSMEKAYDAEIKRQASQVPADPEVQTPKDQEIVDRYRQVTQEPDPRAIAAAKTNIERDYADDTEPEPNAVAGAEDEDVAEKLPQTVFAAATPDETDPVALDPRSAKATDQYWQNAERTVATQAAATANYAPSRNVEQAVEAVPTTAINRPADTSKVRTATPPRQPVKDIEQSVAPQQASQTPAAEPKAEDIKPAEPPMESNRKYITYYSPKLKQYIIEAI